ncbi:MAG: HAD-IB family hydrolase [Myxococcaceae bacterium]|nr:HAD-IB family hydrolase [Myxococcaceae bacterium]
MAIAFFDFDRTLIAANSAVLWLRSELRLGHISPFKALAAMVWVARYHLGFAGRGEGLKHAIASLAGSSETEFRERTIAFYERKVRGLYRPGARRALDEHRARGDRLVLLTSTSFYLAELVARDLQLDAVLCNRFEVDAGGLYTGRPLGDVCYGEGKLLHAERYARSASVSLSECAFYTDSFADLPVMAAVGRPVAVNPDGRLRRIALSRHWEIVDWGEPSPAQLLTAG